VRRALNENAVLQIVIVAILLIAVAFLFATRVLNREGEAATATPATEPATAEAAAPSAEPSAAAATPSIAGTASPAPAAAVGEFEAGPGLPNRLVSAYEDGDTVVLLVTRRVGIDDRELRSLVGRARSRGDVSVFVTNAGRISRYSRITQGVDVNRVPALVVMKPRSAVKGDTPEAGVSYGFRSAESILQAIRDAGYRGRADLPAYPE
jgi:hypothetical protein